MDDLFLEGPIVFSSPNGKFRVKLHVGDDGSLMATLWQRDADDPDKWNAGTASGNSPTKFLLQTVPNGRGVINYIK